MIYSLSEIFLGIQIWYCLILASLNPSLSSLSLISWCLAIWKVTFLLWQSFMWDCKDHTCTNVLAHSLHLYRLPISCWALTCPIIFDGSGALPLYSQYGQVKGSLIGSNSQEFIGKNGTLKFLCIGSLPLLLLLTFPLSLHSWYLV